MLGPASSVALACLACAAFVHGDNQVLQVVRDRSKKALEGRVIRVTFTTIENPYIFKDETGAWTGVLPDFLFALGREASFIIVEVPLSNESFDLLKSSNTACARDVWKNRTDLCVGNSWVTTQRLGYAKVLPTLWQETLQLGVRLVTNTSILDALLQAFRPFHTWLWLAIATVIACYAVFQWSAEHWENHRDFPNKHKLVSGLTSLYHGLFGFFWSEPPTRPVTAEGRILAVGFGFFTVIMLSSYTASLASVLVNSNSVPEFKDLQDAIDRKAKVCMWTSVLSRAEKTFPGLTPLASNMGGSYEDGYDNMAAGNCQVVLVDTIFHKKAQERSERDCDKVLRPGAVVDINCAWPVADWLAGPLSYFVTYLMDQGVLDDLRRAYTPRVLCPDKLEAEGFGVGNVSGVFFIMVGVFIASFVVHSCRRTIRFGHRQSANIRKSILDRLPVSERSSSTARNTTSSQDSRNSSGAPPRRHSIMSDPPRASVAGVNEPSRMSQQSPPRHSGHADYPVIGIDFDNPGYALVQAFHGERLLKSMPFEKALLVMGEAHTGAREEVLRLLRDRAGVWRC